MRKLLFLSLTAIGIATAAYAWPREITLHNASNTLSPLNLTSIKIGNGPVTLFIPPISPNEFDTAPNVQTGACGQSVTITFTLRSVAQSVVWPASGLYGLRGFNACADRDIYFKKTEILNPTLTFR